MNTNEKIFLQNNCSMSRCGEVCQHFCALNDLIAGDSFSGCEHCVFAENLEIISEIGVLCTRFMDLCCR